jgi:hypothetical protein
MTKRYLVVGVNDYIGFDPSGSLNLGPCEADAQSIEEMLAIAPSLSATHPKSQILQLRGQASRMEEGFLDDFIQSE